MLKTSESALNITKIWKSPYAIIFKMTLKEKDKGKIGWDKKYYVASKIVKSHTMHSSECALNMLKTEISDLV